jgi:hypothetical protein
MRVVCDDAQRVCGGGGLCYTLYGYTHWEARVAALVHLCLASWLCTWHSMSNSIIYHVSCYRFVSQHTYTYYIGPHAHVDTDSDSDSKQQQQPPAPAPAVAQRIQNNTKSSLLHYVLYVLIVLCIVLCIMYFQSLALDSMNESATLFVFSLHKEREFFRAALWLLAAGLLLPIYLLPILNSRGAYCYCAGAPALAAGGLRPSLFRPSASALGYNGRITEIHTTTMRSLAHSHTRTLTHHMHIHTRTQRRTTTAEIYASALFSARGRARTARFGWAACLLPA